jgi:hypothetical protein
MIPLDRRNGEAASKAEGFQKLLFLDYRLDNRQQITRLDSLLVVCFQAVTEIVDGGDFKRLSKAAAPRFESSNRANADCGSLT